MKGANEFEQKQPIITSLIAKLYYESDFLKSKRTQSKPQDMRKKHVQHVLFPNLLIRLGFKNDFQIRTFTQTRLTQATLKTLAQPFKLLNKCN